MLLALRLYRGHRPVGAPAPRSTQTCPTPVPTPIPSPTPTPEYRMPRIPPAVRRARAITVPIVAWGVRRRPTLTMTTNKIMVSPRRTREEVDWHGQSQLHLAVLRPLPCPTPPALT